MTILGHLQQYKSTYTCSSKVQKWKKGKVHPRTGHEAVTSALCGMGGQRHAPAVYPWARDQAPIVQECEYAPGSVWAGAENLAPTQIRLPSP